MDKLTTEELKDKLIQAQNYLLNVPRVQQDVVVLQQELQKRSDEKKPGKKAGN